jgi:hypothetical protein
MSKYPKRGMFLRIDRRWGIEAIASIGLIKRFLNFLTQNKRGKMYRFSEKVLNNAEVNISVQSLYLLKIISLMGLCTIFIFIRFTNIDVIKTSAIMRSSENINILNIGGIKDDYTYNFSLYNAVLKRIGEQNIKKLSDSEKINTVKKVLPEFVNSKDPLYIEEKSSSIVHTYNSVSSIRLINWEVVSVFLISLWIPEIFLFLRRILLSSRYKKEVIKLENIFELLAGVKEFKTSQIIDEMGKSSKIYRKHLFESMDLFKRDKKLGLESLKLSVKNTRFSKLVDVIRIYSIVDKELAIQILERNRLEKEEELLLTAQEDIDIIDIIAFASIVPILLELANLFMKTMMDMINQAFQFI